MNLKKDIWLILAALSLLGMIILPKSAYSAVREIPVIADIPALNVSIPALRISEPLMPANLPTRPIAIPSIGGPLTRLPSPDTGVPTLPGAVIRVATAQLEPARAQVSVFSAAQKAFAASADEQQPSQSKLNTAFDNTKADAEKAEARDEAPVQLPKRKKRREQTHLTLPEYDLLTEIGVPR